MLIYLVRHAHALPADDDASRPLSERGREECQRLNEFFHRNQAFGPAQLWHSPLVRARETATLLRSGPASESVLVETSGLLPDDDVEEIAVRLNALTEQTVAVVGHEPHLSALATLLVFGKRKPVAYNLKKGAVLALERTDSLHKKTEQPRWQVCWHISPTLLKPANAPLSRTS